MQQDKTHKSIKTWFLICYKLEANVDTPIFTMTLGIKEQMEEHLDVDLALPLSMIVE